MLMEQRSLGCFSSAMAMMVRSSIAPGNMLPFL